VLQCPQGCLAVATHCAWGGRLNDIYGKFHGSNVSFMAPVRDPHPGGQRLEAAKGAEAKPAWRPNSAHPKRRDIGAAELPAGSHEYLRQMVTMLERSGPRRTTQCLVVQCVWRHRQRDENWLEKAVIFRQHVPETPNASRLATRAVRGAVSQCRRVQIRGHRGRRPREALHAAGRPPACRAWTKCHLPDDRTV
jgi:hypothetical protein